jgi:histidyl-tRNA synthetase
MSSLRAVKGMNDVLPEEIPRWRRIEQAFWRTCDRYGYGEIRTPIVEPTSLFVRSIGEVTDIVEKEMYTFTDKGEQSLTLRPEGTASAVRAYIEHTIASKDPVTKWAYLGPMFRRERPARGRYRQFWQAGAEVLGDPGPHIDAEMIDMVVSLLSELGATDLEVLINSLGSTDGRARYREALVQYLTPHAGALSPDSQRRLATSPLRILDSKAPADREIVAGAPKILDHLSDEDAAHFAELERTLGMLGVRYRVDPTLVRGFDYYQRTLFEVQGKGGELGAQNALCGGGRYDGLVEQLGGPRTPSIGFALGIERLLLVSAAQETDGALDVFVVTTDAALRSHATVLLKELRAEGLRADADLRGGSVKSQFRRSDKLEARVALIVGPDELERGVVQAKDLRTGEQKEVPRAGIADAVKRSLGREHA